MPAALMEGQKLNHEINIYVFRQPDLRLSFATRLRVCHVDGVVGLLVSWSTKVSLFAFALGAWCLVKLELDK